MMKILHDKSIDLSLIQETKLNKETNFYVNGYRVIRKDREIGRRGSRVEDKKTPRGGILILGFHTLRGNRTAATQMIIQQRSKQLRWTKVERN